MTSDFDFLTELPKDAFFSIFIPSHQKLATKLIQHFISTYNFTINSRVRVLMISNFSIRVQKSLPIHITSHLSERQDQPWTIHSCPERRKCS
jgi:hypothetical protein